MFFIKNSFTYRNKIVSLDMKNIGFYFLLTAIAIDFSSCKKDSSSGQLEFKGISTNTGSYGSTMTIYANNFSTGKDTIKLNGVPCNIVDIKGSSITIDIPKGAGPGYFTITDGSKILQGPSFLFVYTGTVSTVAGSLDNGSIDGTGLDASFLFLDGVVVNSKGNLNTVEFTGGDPYATTYEASSRIRQITPAGVVTTFCGSGQYGFKDGSASEAGFGQLRGIAIDAAGNLYVSDYYYNKIRKITPTGDVTTIAGDGNAGFKDGPADSAIFKGPGGIAVDAIGNVYVADNGNLSIRRISPDGMVTTMTSAGFTALTDLSQSHLTFTSPWAICLDHQGNFLVGDNGSIWKITPDGTQTNFISTEDGPRPNGFAYSNGMMGRIAGLIEDSHGHVYATDIDNSAIYQVSIYGINLFAGIRGQFLPFADGPVATATFIDPVGLAIDKDDNIYVADDYRMRKITVQ
jgi:sugar lactone lactonase YvrE